ncbi:MAG: HD domain-containing phosphohydrolase [Desulfocapsaceae bacterium]
MVTETEEEAGMPENRLAYAVTDLEGNLLLPAGTKLTRQVMQDLARRESGTIKFCRLLDSSQIKEDLVSYLAVSPYDVITSHDTQHAALLEIAGEVHVPEAILNSFFRFRETDIYTYRHLLLVFALSILIARELIGEKEKLLQEVIAGPTHDIGKLCIPPAILSKQTPLSRAEHEYLKHHALAGYVLLVYYFRNPEILAARVARDHHERKDGSGYPAGRPVDDLLIDIVMVADIYDALISPRPYRPVSYENRSALEELIAQARRGSISETVVRVLVALNRRSKPHQQNCVISTKRRGEAPSENVYGLTKEES